MIDLDLTQSCIRYPKEGYLSSMAVMDAAEEIEKNLKVQNNSTIGLSLEKTDAEWTYRIVMDSANKYHIDIFIIGG